MTKSKEGNSLQNNKPKILFWDVETSLIIAATFSLRPDHIPHDGIIQDWSIICGAWKWQGEDTTHHAAVTKYGNDRQVCKKLRDVLEQADIVVGHNSDKFDIRKLNARLIYHGLEPLPQLTTVDTLKQVRKIAQFTSNRLDYLGKFLLGKGKIHTESGLWMQVMTGDKEALRKMVDYNKGDVILLEELYDYLLPYMVRHPHIGLITGGNKVDCPKCGSVRMQRQGVRVTTTIKYTRLKCSDCGSWHQTPYNQLKQ